VKKALSLVVLLALTASFAFAQSSETDAPKMTTSKHDFVPFIGYQILEGGTRGYNLTFDIKGQKYIPDTTISNSEELDYNTQAPMVGIGYRYIVNPFFYGEASGGVLLDKKNFSYSVLADFGTFTQRYHVYVSRSHTVFIGADAVGTYQILNNLRAGVRAGGGYVYRSVTTTTDITAGVGDMTLKIYDPDKLYKVRGGLELSFFHNDVLMLEGTLLYTQFIPTDSDQKSYGGLGWQFAIFPVWLN